MIKTSSIHSHLLAKNVAICAFFSGKIEKFGNLTGVKDLTSSMSDYRITQLNAPSITATDRAPYKASHEVVKWS